MKDILIEHGIVSEASLSDITGMRSGRSDLERVAYLARAYFESQVFAVGKVN